MSESHEIQPRIVTEDASDPVDERTFFQRHPILFVLLLATVVVFLVFGGFQMTHGDTIHLKDGRTFHGKVYSDRDSNGRKLDTRIYRVEFLKGYMDIAKDRVVKVEKNDKDSFIDHDYDIEDK